MNKKLAAPMIAWAVASGGAHAEAIQVAATRQLADLTLEQLSNLEVTSVSGRAESLQDAAGSVYVITAQDIRRSTATSLAEALRLAPNLVVAQTSAGQWAISARGFNDSISNKLLVLVDGRIVYSQLFAGVFWDANDVVLEDIERIEVISGPGGTLWGANAVNGVINVVTRSAADTQGVLASVTRSGQGGRELAQWGGALGEDAHARVYALVVDRDNTHTETGRELPDAATRNQAGFRADWTRGVGSMTLQGDIYRGGDEPANNLAPRIHGGNVLARWDSQLANGSPYKVQASYDLMDRDDTNLFRNRARTFDLEFTHDPKVAHGQLLWGAGYRRTTDLNQPTASVLFVPAERALSFTNVFAQYQWLLSEQLQATIGTKLERNSYTGTEVLPSLRLAWLHTPQRTSWVAVSRAVRAPSRIDRDFFFPGRAPFVIAGGPEFQSEVANVYELGHRAQVGNALSYSATVFRQQYKGLRSGVPGVAPATVQNLVNGSIDGIEAWGSLQATERWRVSAGYLALHPHLRFAGDVSPSTTSFPGLGNDPRYQWMLRSSLDVGARSEFDVMVRRVGQLPAPAVPAYTAVDVSWGLQVSPTLRLSLMARNLLDPGHREFNAPAAGSEIDRRFLLQATWQL